MAQLLNQMSEGLVKGSGETGMKLVTGEEEGIRFGTQ